MPAVNGISIMIHVVWVVNFLLKKHCNTECLDRLLNSNQSCDQLTCPKDNKQQQHVLVCCILSTDFSFCQQTLELPIFFKLLWFKPFCRLQSLRCTIPWTPESDSFIVMFRVATSTSIYCQNWTGRLYDCPNWIWIGFEGLLP